ncbi:hypothetical protein HL658_02450 [Azospirillum sp. RWY-5-1]|uniref:Uncharacterized protein n=1 Tax=Azospirillum oleiclasticum TaxID=2735135 RepID=A0ABX2T5Y0_9PROT|nr:hypothetical protein [Azospirillum oleiclasticum]NYZ11397.1 hypothetical protein [Azospirillum oleiclasticum]NYZ18558.1 hypothetical protein [Azospirillum oleiclasticum]
MVVADDIAVLVVWYTVSAFVVQPAARSAAKSMAEMAQTNAQVIEPVPDPNASLQWLTDALPKDGRQKHLFLGD